MTKIKEEFSDEYIPQTNWFKFENVGDAIKGTLINRYSKPGGGDMPDQEVLELKNVEINNEPVESKEDVWNVPIKSANNYILQRIKNVKIGQRIGFVFSKEIPASVKGHHPAKSIQPYVWGIDPEFESMTEEDKIDVDQAF